MKRGLYESWKPISLESCLLKVGGNRAKRCIVDKFLNKKGNIFLLLFFFMQISLSEWYD